MRKSLLMAGMLIVTKSLYAQNNDVKTEKEPGKVTFSG